MKKYKKNKWPSLVLMGILLCSASLVLGHIPDGFAYNSDVNISPIGMAIAQSYRELPFSFTQGQTGYISNAFFAVYNHWPPLGFYVLSLWQSVVGADLESSRLLYWVLQLFNVLLFHQLLRRFQLPDTIVLGTVFLFSLLPFRLAYSTLLFADSWVLPFWLLALLLYTAPSKPAKPAAYASLLLGTAFSWQVFFMLPAFVLYETAQRTRFSLLQLCLVLGGLTTAAFELLYFTTAEQASIFKQLSHYSISHLLHEPLYWTPLLIKKGIKVGIEASAAGSIWLLSLKYGKATTTNTQLQSALEISGLSLLVYLLVMPNLFALHEHQVMLFDLWIGLFTASCLLRLPKSWQKRGLAIGTGLLLANLAIIPLTQTYWHSTQARAEAIVQWVNQQKTEPDKRICLFVHITQYQKKGEWLLHPYAVKAQTNAYLFNNLQQTEAYLGYELAYRVKRLEELPIQPIASNEVFVISQEEKSFPSASLAASTQIDGFFLYKIHIHAYRKQVS